MDADKIIVIGGGVGPLAGVKLHQHIIANTPTDGTDQDHLDIYHLSRSNDIADRTEAILAGTPELPARGMFRTFQIADAALRKAGRSGVGGIPCNTFHAPAIFDLFQQWVSEAALAIEIVHMLEQTAMLLQTDYPTVKTVGLLSTTGTRKVRVYHDILEPMGFSLVEVSERDQHDLHAAIYNPKWGIKATPAIHPTVRNRFEQYVRDLVEQGAQAVILGCTEIPLALPESELFGVPLVDPMYALAKALIRKAR